jgi:hypothetical protein
MHAEPLQPQEETRSEQVNVKLTPSEKADLKLVSGFDVIPEADLVRESLASVRERAADIRAGRAKSRASTAA